MGIKTKFKRGHRRNHGLEGCPYRPLWKAAVFELSRRFGWVCWYCGVKLCLDTVSLDHIISLSDGGADEIDNLALCCRWCQYGKGARPLNDFLNWLELVRAHESPLMGETL